MIEASLYTVLNTAIGVDVGNRIYPLVAPVGTATPCAVYNTVTTQVEHTIDGATDLRHTHVQVDIYSATFLQSKTIAEEVVTAMIGWTTHVSVHVDDAGTAMIEDTVQPNLYRVSMRFVVSHQAA